MQQFDHESLTKIPIDMYDTSVPDSVRKLTPVLFSDGDGFCCVLGPDPQAGVFGCGYTPKAALADWDKHLQERRLSGDTNDEVVKYIQEHMGVETKEDMPFETPDAKGLS